VQHWNVKEISAPDGSRSPAVLHSLDGEARVVAIHLQPGQQLGDHQVKEGALLVVVDGLVHVESGGESVHAGVGSVFRFDPDERRSVSADDDARVLLVLAPWPGEGHYRGGDDRRVSSSSAS
jgi:quercetin dioxygenase-like cupin family protein